MSGDDRLDGTPDATRADPFREPWPDPDEDVRAQFRTLGRSVRARSASFVPGGVPSLTFRPPERVETYWRWFAGVLFLVVTLDMITTMYAVDAVGPAGEANPLVRLVIERGVLEYAALNLVAVVVAVACFQALVRVVRADDAPYARYVEAGLGIWLGLLLAAGLFVFANNLAVIVFGRSLLG